MIPFNFSVLLMTSVAQSQLTLLLKEGTIFDPLFRWSWLRKMRACSLCLGFWTSVITSLLVGIYSPIFVLSVAAIGYVFSLLRDKYLPCKECRVESVSFKMFTKD